MIDTHLYAKYSAEPTMEKHSYSALSSGIDSSSSAVITKDPVFPLPGETIPNYNDIPPVDIMQT